MTAYPRLPWGLFRRPDGSLSVDFKAFADDRSGVLLSSHETRPDAAAARDARQAAEEREEAIRRGQEELPFGGEE